MKLLVEYLFSRPVVAISIFIASLFIGAVVAFGWFNPPLPPPNPYGPLSSPTAGSFSGNIGLQATTSEPASTFSVAGNLGVGNTYFGVPAPVNGAIVEEKLGIGTANVGSPYFASPVSVVGGLALDATLHTGYWNTYVPQSSESSSIPYATGRYMSMSVGSDGLPMLSFYNAVGGFQFLKCTSPNCSTGVVNFIASGSVIGADNSVINGPDGFPILAFNTTTGAKVAKCNDLFCNSFSIAPSPTQSFETAPNATNPSIRISPQDGFPIVAYYLPETDIGGGTNVGRLRVIKCLNSSCTSYSSPITLDTDTGPSVALAIGYDGRPIIVYHRAPDLKFIRCISGDCSQVGNWASPITLLTGGSLVSDIFGGRIALTIGNDGFPMISYSGVNTGGGTIGEISFLHCGDVACSPAGNTTSVIDRQVNNGVGGWHSMTLAADGHPVIFYPDFATNAVRFGKCGDELCSVSKMSTTTIPSANASPLGTSVIVGSDGLPVAAYRNASQIIIVRCKSDRCISNWARR